MPTYEYRCKRCKREVDCILPMDRKKEPRCKVCGAQLVRVFRTSPSIRVVGGTRTGMGSALGNTHTPERDKAYEMYKSGELGYEEGELLF